jgi:hypothetical protein
VSSRSGSRLWRRAIRVGLSPCSLPLATLSREVEPPGDDLAHANAPRVWRNKLHQTRRLQRAPPMQQQPQELLRHFLHQGSPTRPEETILLAEVESLLRPWCNHSSALLFGSYRLDGTNDRSLSAQHDEILAPGIENRLTLLLELLKFHGGQNNNVARISRPTLHSTR